MTMMIPISCIRLKITSVSAWAYDLYFHALLKQNPSCEHIRRTFRNTRGKHIFPTGLSVDKQPNKRPKMPYQLTFDCYRLIKIILITATMNDSMQAYWVDQCSHEMLALSTSFNYFPDGAWASGNSLLFALQTLNICSIFHVWLLLWPQLQVNNL